MIAKNKILYVNSSYICIDKEDAHILEKHKFHVEVNNNDNVRLRTNIKGKHYSLHRLVCKTKKEVDHIRNNPFDNRKKYLRPATRTENARNRKLFKNNSTGYRGVTVHKSGKYLATIKLKDKSKYLGLFENPKCAALAYNEAAIKHHRTFAKLNRVS